MNNLLIHPSAKPETLGERIKLARQSKCLTRAKFASLLNVSATIAGLWERDVKRPRDENIRGIAKLTGVSYVFLVAGEMAGIKPASAPTENPLKELILKLDSSEGLSSNALKALQDIARKS